MRLRLLILQSLIYIYDLPSLQRCSYFFPKESHHHCIVQRAFTNTKPEIDKSNFALSQKYQNKECQSSSLLDLSTATTQIDTNPRRESITAMLSFRTSPLLSYDFELCSRKDSKIDACLHCDSVNSHTSFQQFTTTNHEGGNKYYPLNSLNHTLSPAKFLKTSLKSSVQSACVLIFQDSPCSTHASQETMRSKKKKPSVLHSSESRNRHSGCVMSCRLANRIYVAVRWIGSQVEILP
jgi:hypothetical protein